MTEALVAEKIRAYDEDQLSIQHFRKCLIEFAQLETNPTVIIIDELDRCRPSFAVQLIERIKHFFDIPNIVFVLMINRDQLEKSIKGVYGSEIDATGYLLKFIDVPISLPKRSDVSTIPYDHIVKYALQMLNHFDFRENDGLPSVIADALKLWGPLFDLSLRDIERIFTIICLNNKMNTVPDLKIWLAILKIKKPQLYEGIRYNNCLAHNEASELSSKLLEKYRRLEETQKELLEALSILHKWFSKGCPEDQGKQLVDRISALTFNLPNNRLDLRHLFTHALNAIDMSSDYEI